MKSIAQRCGMKKFVIQRRQKGKTEPCWVLLSNRDRDRCVVNDRPAVSLLNSLSVSHVMLFVLEDMRETTCQLVMFITSCDLFVGN